MKLFGALCVGLSSCMLGASAATEWEFLSCPVTESVPGFTFKNVSALGVAVLVNASEDIGTFLDNGCDPNFSGTYLTYIDTKCVNPIFEKLGIPCTRQIKIEGYTPLMLAVLHGTAATVKKLAEQPEINLDAQTSDSFSPLWTAAESGNLEMVTILVEAGASLEIEGSDYLMTPLGISVRREHLAVVRFLISQGANVNSRSNTGYAPASYAAFSGNVEILKMLQKAGADLDGVGGPANRSLLTDAAAGNKVEVVDFLLSEKVDLNRQDADKKNAVYFAAIFGYLDILQSLEKAGADLDILYGENQFSALSLALLEGHTDVAVFLIKKGANVDTQSAKGFTSSWIAVQEGHLSVLKALAEAGANLETPGGSFESTPLIKAGLSGQLEIVKFLKEEGVNLDTEDKDGKTALDLARGFGKDSIVKLLEEK